ncbi:Redoxin [Mucilaginibacter pineti]|uniref:Redoxin n=1 Tax=Mucilaginibacter pineti TaxID=1391627 RepID=A0A1G6TWK1_9SPHI|nr:TlpA disulfide reductase family protein [Mucilaginibacter pineti]SDD33463.1 Redoxin [Mucilaginibacter pineti]
MKKILFLMAMLCCNYVKAQNITINITGSPDTVVKINYPVDGINYNYWQNQKTYRLDSKNTIQFPNTLKAGNFIYISNNGKLTPVFITPGKSLQIDLTVNDKKQTLTVKGPNADGIVLYNNLNHPSYQLKARFYYSNDTTAAGLKKAIDLDITKELHRFDSLLKVKKVSEEFYRFTERDIRYYYAAVLSSAIFVQYIRTTYDHNRPDYKAVFNKDLEDAWPEIYKTTPPNNQFATGAPEFFYYAKDYATWYKLIYLAKKNGTYNEPLDGSNYFNRFYDSFKANFTGKNLEYLQARFIFDEAMEKQYQPQLVTLYNRFIKDYPKSNFTTYLTQLINEITAYHKRAAQALSAEQIILPTDGISTFDQLMATFKGKTVYVDMWATWCGPCKDEFQYAADVRKYLKDKNVESLFISMDNDGADKQWRDMIKFYNLSGNHARVNNTLLKDLLIKFWDGKGYSIPRYVLVKDGVIIEKDAARPSDKQILYDQISKHL